MEKRIVQGLRARRGDGGGRRILLVRLDAIGDYVLFRNFLRFMRGSRRFRGARLAVLGNPAWRGLAEAFDADCADEWLWLADPARYFRRGRENLLPAPVWRRRVRREQDALRAELKGRAFDCVVSPRVDRDPLLDGLLAGVAPEAIGAKGPSPSPGDAAYTSLVDVADGPFVFDRNRSFMTGLTGERPDVRLHLETPRAPGPPGEAAPIVLCVGASHWTKRLPRRTLRDVARLLLDRTDRELVVAGGESDAARAQALADAVGAPSRLRVVAGRVSLAGFARLAAGASCVVSHDTGPMHIAAAVGVPVVCVANGYSGAGAFWPYPDGRVRMCLPRPPLPPLPAPLPLAQLRAARAIASVSAEDVASAAVAAVAAGRAGAP